MSPSLTESLIMVRKIDVNGLTFRLCFNGGSLSRGDLWLMFLTVSDWRSVKKKNVTVYSFSCFNFINIINLIIFNGRQLYQCVLNTHWNKKVSILFVYKFRILVPPVILWKNKPIINTLKIQSYIPIRKGDMEYLNCKKCLYR